MIPIELHTQFSATHPDLNSDLVQIWVQATVAEVLAIYEEADQLPPYAQAVFTLRFCDADEAQKLNKNYRGKDYATNVLTFEYGVDENATLRSDIIICIPVLETEAEEQHKPFLHHAAHLCVHGVLHALGYDHIEEEEAEEMEELEIDILAHLTIANPYSD